MKFKKILSLSLLTPVAITAPFVVASCSESLPYGDTTKGEQSEILQSDEAKLLVLDNWLTSTYTSLYSSYIKPNASKDDKLKISNTLSYYLNNLSWPTNDNSTNLDDFASDTIFSSDDKTKFETLVKDAYKFYISYMSTVSTSDNSSPSTYFKIKKYDWIKSEFSTIIPIKDGEKEITLADIDLGVNYTGCDDLGQVIENDFKVLMLTRGTEVYQNVMKMLLSEMYFIHSTEELVKNGTNFNKLTKKVNSVNYINTMAYVGEEHDFSTYLLKKYLVENSPQFKWTYSSSDYSTSIALPSVISTLLEFNNIKTTKETSLKDVLSPNSNESEANSISNLQAFGGLELSASTSSDDSSEDSSTSSPKDGDLSVDLNNIKSFGSIKAGLFDDESNKLFSFTELEAIKKAFELNKTLSTKLMIPQIKILESSKNKKSHSISFNDLDVKWGDTIGNVNADEKAFINGDQKLIINSITYTPENSNNKEITIDFTYEFKNNGNTYSFDYSYVYSDWWDSDKEETNPFINAYIFDGDSSSVGIKIFNSSSEATGISYYLRILPIFEKVSQLPIGENSQWYMQGKFTFNGTPWETEKEQRKLAYWFVLSDSNLYAKIQNFYLFNDFNVEGNVDELTSLISSLGLSKKTTSDRQTEGII